MPRLHLISFLAIGVASLLLPLSASQPGVPMVILKNSCAPGQEMPAIGLGTGAYSGDPSVGYGNYPECWSSTSGCGAYVQVCKGEKCLLNIKLF